MRHDLCQWCEIILAETAALKEVLSGKDTSSDIQCRVAREPRLIGGKGSTFTWGFMAL